MTTVEKRTNVDVDKVLTGGNKTIFFNESSSTKYRTAAAGNVAGDHIYHIYIIYMCDGRNEIMMMMT